MTVPGARWQIWVMTLAALVLAVRMATFAIADHLAAADPALAILLDAGQSRARLVQVEQALGSTPPDLAAARLAARAVLHSDPLAAGALRELGRIALFQGDGQGAQAMLTASAAIAPHDLYAQIWVLDQRLQGADWTAAVRQVDLIFRGQNPDIWGPVAIALAPILTAPQLSAPLVALLASRPPWRPWLLAQIAGTTPNFDGLTALYSGLRATPAPPEIAELRAFLTRMVGAGRIEEAYFLWLQSLPPVRLGDLGLLYNGDFRLPVTDLPFDWTFAPVTGALASLRADPAHRAQRLLAVDFFGNRVLFRHVSHLLLLPPGAYRFSGREQSVALRNDRGLVWRLTCANDLVLGETAALKGDTAWRNFALDFTVPEACPTQKLELVLPARVVLEQEISGTALYGNLTLRSN